MAQADARFEMRPAFVRPRWNWFIHPHQISRPTSRLPRVSKIPGYPTCRLYRFVQLPATCCWLKLPEASIVVDSRVLGHHGIQAETPLDFHSGRLTEVARLLPVLRQGDDLGSQGVGRPRPGPIRQFPEWRSNPGRPHPLRWQYRPESRLAMASSMVLEIPFRETGSTNSQSPQHNRDIRSPGASTVNRARRRRGCRRPPGAAGCHPPSRAGGNFGSGRSPKP